MGAAGGAGVIGAAGGGAGAGSLGGGCQAGLGDEGSVTENLLNLFREASG
jgi:hypothetical protein